MQEKLEVVQLKLTAFPILPKSQTASHSKQDQAIPCSFLVGLLIGHGKSVMYCVLVWMLN